MPTEIKYRKQTKTKTVEYEFPTFDSQWPELSKLLRNWHQGNVRFPMIDLLEGRTTQELIVVNQDGLFDMPVIRVLTKDMLREVFDKGYNSYQDETLDTEMSLRDWVETYFGDMREIKRNEYSYALIDMLIDSELPEQYDDPSMKIGFEQGQDEPNHVRNARWLASRRLDEDWDM